MKDPDPSIGPAGRSVPDPAPRAGGLVPRATVATGDAPAPLSPLAPQRDADRWPDAWLVAAARREPPDAAALDALVARHWGRLHARCELLTLDRQAASDLAQETWCRVLRARHGLDPDGNFVAYLLTIATNVWRDWNRSARRAGPMADRRLASLDATLESDDGDATVLADVLVDPDALPLDEQALLALDLDRALARLAPRARDVLVARYVDGSSAAEIGARYGRTEQTVTTWIRRALAELRTFLDDAGRAPQAGR